MAISEPTAVFSIRDDKDQEIKQVMQLVYGALEEKGYNPCLFRQQVRKRPLIRRIDRDDLLQALVRDYVRNG